MRDYAQRNAKSHTAVKQLWEETVEVIKAPFEWTSRKQVNKGAKTRRSEKDMECKTEYNKDGGPYRYFLWAEALSERTVILAT